MVALMLCNVCCSRQIPGFVNNKPRAHPNSPELWVQRWTGGGSGHGAYGFLVPYTLPQHQDSFQCKHCQQRQSTDRACSWELGKETRPKPVFFQAWKIYRKGSH